METFKVFMIKAAANPLPAAPDFFKWAVPSLLTLIGLVVWFAFWLGKKLSEGQIEQLKGKAGGIRTTPRFAKDRADTAIDEATETKAKFEAFTRKIHSQAPREVLQNAREAVDMNFNRLLTASSSTASVLRDHAGTAGFDKHGKPVWQIVIHDKDDTRTTKPST